MAGAPMKQGDGLRPTAGRRDVPSAEVHLLDAGHFARDEQPDHVTQLTRTILRTDPHRTARSARFLLSVSSTAAGR
jgi:hypothetical protein